MVDIWAFAVLSIPAMIILGLRHALDVDHITAIDNLVRLHNATRKSTWVGAAFSSGHMLAVLAEMIFIIYVVAGISGINGLSLWGGILGAIALGTIGSVNLYSMKKWRTTSSAILASKIPVRTGIHKIGPFGSSLVTGLVFGLGFDTATQISAIIISAVASATAGIQVALVLAGFFALGMIPTDTVDSIMLRSAFRKIFNTRSFGYMSYGLSGSALAIAALESYSAITGSDLLPQFIGPMLTVSIIGTSFALVFITRSRKVGKIHEHRHEHAGGFDHVHPHEHPHVDELAHDHEHQYESEVEQKGNGKGQST